MEKWSVGCNASHVVTEGASIQRYLGYSCNFVTVSVYLCLLFEYYYSGA